MTDEQRENLQDLASFIGPSHRWSEAIRAALDELEALRQEVARLKAGVPRRCTCDRCMGGTQQEECGR